MQVFEDLANVTQQPPDAAFAITSSGPMTRSFKRRIQSLCNISQHCATEAKAEHASDQTKPGTPPTTPGSDAAAHSTEPPKQEQQPQQQQQQQQQQPSSSLEAAAPPAKAAATLPRSCSTGSIRSPSLPTPRNSTPRGAGSDRRLARSVSSGSWSSGTGTDSDQQQGQQQRQGQQAQQGKERRLPRMRINGRLLSPQEVEQQLAALCMPSAPIDMPAARSAAVAEAEAAAADAAAAALASPPKRVRLSTSLRLDVDTSSTPVLLDTPSFAAGGSWYPFAGAGGSLDTQLPLLALPENECPALLSPVPFQPPSQGLYGSGGLLQRSCSHGQFETAAQGAAAGKVQQLTSQQAMARCPSDLSCLSDQELVQLAAASTGTAAGPRLESSNSVSGSGTAAQGILRPMAVRAGSSETPAGLPLRASTVGGMNDVAAMDAAAPGDLALPGGLAAALRSDNAAMRCDSAAMRRCDSASGLWRLPSLELGGFNPTGSLAMQPLVQEQGAFAAGALWMDEQSVAVALEGMELGGSQAWNSWPPAALPSYWGQVEAALS